MEDNGQYFYHPLENIEDVDVFYEAVEREHLTKAISPERPYTYWTIELYDQKNGIRGGGGLGVLAADTRRVAEKMNVHVRTISKIENGHSFVSAETLCKLCQFFNLPPKSFFDIDKISDRRNKKLNELIDKLKTSDKEKIEFYYNLINLVDEKIK